MPGGQAAVDEAAAWPAWPQAAPNAERYVADAVRSGRWAISSMYNGHRLYERRFAEAFAGYLGARHCVPTDHCSSGLVIALEALGLEYGSEVVVPALTWVATASAVFRAGLVPVLADVDPGTGTLTPESVAAVTTPRTAAVIVVHWACVMADMPALVAFAGERGLAVIEDAAQAHGASWDGRKAGTFGTFGCFSMQQAKVLSCGEGGAVVTDRADLAQRLEELRADSRSYRDRPVAGQLELAETASVMGANFGLGELAAALLCAQLEALPGQHERRNANYRLFEELLADVPDVELLRRDPRQDTLSLYEVPVRFRAASGRNAEIARELTRRTGANFYPPRGPLGRSALLRPWTKPTFGPLATEFAEIHRHRDHPNAEAIAAQSVLLHHSVFLSEPAGIRKLAGAIRETAAVPAMR